jgi:CrcB protein
MMIWIAIAAGGAIGAMGRYATTLMIAATMGPGWQPLATLSVNIVGSGLMGLLYGLMNTGVISLGDSARLFFQIGFLGALTTFSAFALDVVSLIENDQGRLAAGYILASVLLALAGFMLMLLVVRTIAGGQ